MLTLVGLFVGTLAALASAAACPYLAATLWVANRVIDGLDGAVARAAGTATDLGGYVDIVVDFTVYAMLPAARTMGVRREAGAVPAWAAACLLEAACFVNAASLFCLSALLEKRAAGAAARGDITSVTMIVRWGLLLVELSY